MSSALDATAREARAGTRRRWLDAGTLTPVIAAILFGTYAALQMRWDWLETYYPLLLRGLGMTVLLVVVTSSLGMLLAIPIGLVQVVGPKWLALPARAFCTVIRGTPLLLQLWLLYYGLGSLFPQFPWIRDSALWPILRQAWPYAFLGLTLSYAAYEGEVFRGAFKGVPKGQLDAAKAYGMSGLLMFRRIWLPQAFKRAMPTLAGETILQLKATPLVATITVIDVYSVAAQVRQQTYLTYEPLLLISAIYILMAVVITKVFARLSGQGRDNTAFSRS
ncbi:ABC transporter permease [Shinella sumterensis]|uniref:ABC transporter permease n=1 Tax=Shinella sumterensis TaxID=1967501 RepID=UPI00106EDC5A|nr:ABC transporter permease subunit [Shinella sumterensis]MCD1265803.1 ABC transporter permease subunit [Shinella sumterensis]TFE97397.1 ABC transporter permease [Shinella sumterensis]